ncbi:MAG: DegT/DnrJ/EryC1/StrS aminotransferase family protein [Spirochaetes bacterium]|nr:DegT/DnrJ/EryC1/StrS aminotransferase family protein [Spirochaetota bacterium]
MAIVSSRPTITRKELEGVLDCLIRDDLARGEITKIFETKISELTGYKYAIAVNSATSAYHLAFKALGISPNDEVIIPSFFDAPPLAALSLVGGQASLVDVDADSFFPSVSIYKEKITDCTKALVIGHLFGFVQDISKLLTLEIPTIEDISHSIGSELHDATRDKRATIAIASFSPSMLMTTGNGAVVMTNNSRMYALMKDLRGGNGQSSINYDYIMTDFQGAMGISQLHRLPDFIKRRREIAKMYYDALKITPHKTPFAYNENFTYQCFPILFDAPTERIEKYWKRMGVEIFIPISKPLHSFLSKKPMDFPNSERFSHKLYSLPLYPTLTKKEIEKISKALSSFV